MPRTPAHQDSAFESQVALLTDFIKNRLDLELGEDFLQQLAALFRDIVSQSSMTVMDVQRSVLNERLAADRIRRRGLESGLATAASGMRELATSVVAQRNSRFSMTVNRESFVNGTPVMSAVSTARNSTIVPPTA